MKWTKANEKLPELDKQLCLKWQGEYCSGRFYKNYAAIECYIYGRGTYLKASFVYIEWLDEFSPSPTDESALKDEAEKLYQFSLMGNWGAIGINEVKDRERAAYLAGRRKSLSDQQQMGLLLMDKDGEIEGLKNEVARLEKLLKQTEEISQIATEGLRDATKRIDELEEACKTYRHAYFKKVNGD